MTGKSVVVSIEFGADEIRQHSFDMFTEADYCPNPERTARHFRDAVSDDFPDREFRVISNSRARYLEWRQGMTELLGGEHTIDDFLAVL
ncbi:hypothetical protein [Mycobacteroides abscessus]|uniref:hypothetical protein n=1 Tax=Mycobacteroides abscessus TaxID=36809 RepID=UPI001041C75C|nr:hypothetical protein [Mycobacteroides abscessus]